MNKKLFLTSMLVLGFTGAVFAEPANTSNSFPGDGLMQEDYTYVGQANSTNMVDVYEGSVYANAEYTNTPYPVQPGEYLPQSSETVATCTTGNYCPGNQTYYYDTTQDQGLENCPAGYPSSAAGASAETDCYKACTTANVSHSSSVTGNDYYGAGVDTCEATACVNGYHIETTSDLATCEANIITINWNGTTQDAIAANEAGTCVYDGDIRTPQSATHVPGKTFIGWRFSSTAPSND